MNAPSFTPGPWDYCSCGCGFVGGGDDMVAEVTEGEWGDTAIHILTGKRCLVHHWGTVPLERARANGRLIAAAPELFEALGDVLIHCLADIEAEEQKDEPNEGALTVFRTRRDRAQVALAKARGEQAAP